MEVIVPQEMAAAIDKLREVLEERFMRIAVEARVPPQPNYFTRDEAAEYLRMSTRTLDKMSETGMIRRAKLGDGKRSNVLFRKVDLDTFVEGQLDMDERAARMHVRNLGR